MRLELVTVSDERGEPIYFVDLRGPLGGLLDSRFFASEREAREWMLLEGGA